MTYSQKKLLKNRFRSNLKFQKKEFRKLEAIGSRWHLRQDRFYKTALSNIRKEIRLFRRLSVSL